MGRAVMPPFFVLSGFSLAVTYGSGLNLAPREFWQNRAARILPVYCLVSICAIPLAFLGHGWVTSGLSDVLSHVLINAFCSRMWFVVNLGGFCGPDWTISTLVAFYWLTPKLMRALKRAGEEPPSMCLHMWGLGLPSVWWSRNSRGGDAPAVSGPKTLSAGRPSADSLFRHLRCCYGAQWVSGIWSYVLGNSSAPCWLRTRARRHTGPRRRGRSRQGGF